MSIFWKFQISITTDKFIFLAEQICFIYYIKIKYYIKLYINRSQNNIKYELSINRL